MRVPLPSKSKYLSKYINSLLIIEPALTNRVDHVGGFPGSAVMCELTRDPVLSLKNAKLGQRLFFMTTTASKSTKVVTSGITTWI